MACSCAAAIDAEMKDWVALGGGNSGCCGNVRHTYGFHRPANEIPITDYSRRHEAPRPHNMNWACAGDFHHGFNPALMEKHRALLERLMAGELPMICEMITKPWANKPVYYWARWNGVSTLQRYTGSGHDRWSHISWWRSRANERAYLWTPGKVTETTSKPAGTVAPKFAGKLLKRSNVYNSQVKIWQNQLRNLGWTSLKADGIFGPFTESVVRKFQILQKLTSDGIIGPKTWARAFAIRKLG